MLPHALIKHLEAIAEPQGLANNCPYHYATLCYLKSLYSHINGGNGSKHLYDTQSAGYNKAVAYEKKMQAEEYKRMKKNLEDMKKANEEKEKALKEMEGLKTVNKELHDKIKTIQEAKEKLGIEKKEKKELTEEQIDFYDKAIRVTLKGIEESMGKAMLKGTGETKSANKLEKKGIEIEIQQRIDKKLSVKRAPFSLQKLFNKHYDQYENTKEDSTLLFSELKDNKRIDELDISNDLTWKWMVPWNINFKNIDGTRSELDKKDEKAVDKGGPTREFLANVWNQMGELKITAKGTAEGSHIALFEDCDKYYFPSSDDKIEQQINAVIQKFGEISKQKKEEIKSNLKLKVKRYYRALGRIIVSSECYSKA